MSFIENNEFDSDLVALNTETEAQSLISITSSSINSNDLAFSKKQKNLCSKLFVEKLFEEKDLLQEHPNSQTHYHHPAQKKFERQAKAANLPNYNLILDVVTR
ncbi:13605_t:CDS:2 [Racocetra fulgida]|uniref:13605_t:CDS:1 n=1 Tax=Racocetra fulgida TaxID=60492 RepID=A0A9N9HYI9_9GLOM|nr:13605_t:CDS:2 [Racocetra fulgida]